MICGDKAIFGSSDGRLYVVRLADGRKVTSVDMGAAITASPAIVDGKVIIGATNGRLLALGEKKNKKE